MVVKTLEANFRKLKNQRIELGKKVTVISGHNGTMKSTILGLIAQPFNVEKESGKQDHSSENFKGIDNELLQSRFNKNFKFAFPEYEDKDCLYAKLHFIDKTISEGGYYAFKTIYRKERNKNPVLRIYNAEGSEEGMGYVKDIPVVCMYLDRLYPIGKLSRLSPSTTIMTDKEKELFSEWHKTLIPNEEPRKKQITQASSVIKNVASPTYSNRDHRTLSSGEDVISKILIKIISLIRVYDKLGADYRGSIFLIDEVENSLHPPVQKKLVDLFLKLSGKYKIQFVITTHSVDILRWAYQKRELCLKDASECDNIEIVYLKSTLDKILALRNPKLKELENHLTLQSERSPKINVLVEDEEAQIFASNFLSDNILSRINIKVSKTGCSALASLRASSVLKEINESILLLDGDSQKSVTKAFASQGKNLSNITNIVFLPSNLNPENYIYNFLKSLPEEHDFWSYNEDGSYTKDHFLNYCTVDLSKREVAKDWFNSQSHFWSKGDGDLSPLFSYIRTENFDDYQKFNESFVNTYNNVCCYYMLEPIKNEVLAKNIDRNQLLQNDSRTDSQMLEYFLGRALHTKKEFHLRELDFEVYNLLSDSSAKRRLTSLFKNTYSDKFVSLGNGRFRASE